MRQPQVCTLTNPTGLPSAGQNRRDKDKTCGATTHTSGADGDFELELLYLSTYRSLTTISSSGFERPSLNSALKFHAKALDLPMVFLASMHP